MVDQGRVQNWELGLFHFGPMIFIQRPHQGVVFRGLPTGPPPDPPVRQGFSSSAGKPSHRAFKNPVKCECQ